jgi:PAS domain S-box-containing protein
MFDLLSEGIYRSAPDHSLTFVNRAYLEMFGYGSLAELQAVPRETLYADPSSRRKLLTLLAQQGAFSNQEIEYLRKDGTRFWGLTSARTILDPDTGKVSYQVGAITDITEHRALNQTLERLVAERTAELSASEARFRTLVENAPEAIVVFDGATGKFLFGNSHACQLYGCSPEQLNGMTPADVSPELQPDGRRSGEAALTYMREALNGKTPTFEWTHCGPDGRLIPTEVRLVRLPAEGREMLRASMTDVSERKRREQIQQATFEISEAVHTTTDLNGFFRTVHGIVRGLMPAENFYIALYDPATGLINFDYHVDEMTPRPVACPLGTGLTGFVIRSGKPLLLDQAMVARKREVGDMVTFEGYEDIRYVESGVPSAIWLGVPLCAGGQCLGVMALQDYRDPNAYGETEKRILSFVAGQLALAIERKRAQQALRESEEKFRALFDASSQGVMLHDDKQYIEVNYAAARMFGYSSPSEMVGKHPRNTSPPSQPCGEPTEVMARRYIEECFRKGCVRFDWLARTVQGVDLPLEVILTRIEWGGRRIIQAVIHDLTERKKAEAELHKALAREKELGQLKSNFVSMVSHEFRTPLGVILSSAELLDKHFYELEPEERCEQLQSIRKNTRRMGSLMEEVLVLGMVDAGKMDFRSGPVNLRVFCERLIEEVRSATDRKCPVVFTPGNCPEMATADERLLRHILGNLLTNAVKYSPAATPVRLELSRKGGDAICSVIDQGIGVPAEDLEWVFQPFHRGRNVGGEKGSGLGLTIVKRCVELHGGKIELNSGLGRGTTVRVRLPVFMEGYEEDRGD